LPREPQGPAVNPSFGDQAGSLARRTIVKMIRQPAVLIPPIFLPLFLMAVNASGLDATTKIKGFPTDNYLSFTLAAIFIQGALSAVVIAGGALSEDSRSGFLSRLSLTRLEGPPLVVGYLAGVFALGVFQAVVFLLVALAAGAEVKAGVGGALVLVPLSVLTTLAFRSLGVLVALKSRSEEAVQGLFPVMFVLFFLSSMALPRNLIEKDWFETIATVNPMSYLIEAPRSLLITGWDAEALALGGGIAIGVLLVVTLMVRRTLGGGLVG